MPRGTYLSEDERSRIQSYRECGLTLREIAEKLKRNKKTIFMYLKNPESYRTSNRGGRKPKISQRDIREIKRLATQKDVSPRQIVSILKLPIGTRRVQQILNSDPNITYAKYAPKPKLLHRHKVARLAFAEKHRFWDDEWKSIIFSDEKKFNLDGPDGCHMHWQNKRQGDKTRYSRNFQGGSLMVWAAIGYNGKSPICFIRTKMNAENYIELLDNVLITFAENNWNDYWIFQQDNAAIHNANATKRFFSDKNIPLMTWPAVSPDLNPIENVWGILTKRVFAGGRQFETIKDLKECINAEWSRIDISIIQSLILSMPRRLEYVIKSAGGHTNY